MNKKFKTALFKKESEMPFEQFAHDWLKTYGSSRVKISSVRARSISILFGGPYPITRITKKIYEERILELNEKYSTNYMDAFTLVEECFRKALTQGLIKNNPTEDFKMPKKQ
ncbi:hypothetical protein P8852_05850 [Bacillus spizizenii]|uniref:Uncharacterized protein n=1 Tax=Bacillus spizizenii TaxID=96241 RepID=A0A9Q4DRE9_BACSC|nr:hypothetical protein [Bacillus spizizenii]MCY7842567.1 hypothetical protein [Bacillus spizizenii]MCY8122815.1 hypothetical protein [Bacillus spizizenii]MCY8899669.1 hypothetical protein [Bacillus spizizenii]MCY8906523.1 hypothetical protein [Bacillus spizizenii]